MDQEFFMAFFECHFHSAVLGRAVSLNAVVPQLPFSAATPKTQEYKVVYLFHGLSDDSSMWFRRSSIERYADERKLAIIMPDGGRGFYSDALNGDRYWTFIAEELPFFVQNNFPVSCRREDTFAAGLSMGAYGAIKLGLRLPEKFSAVAGLSSLVDLKKRFRSPDSASWRPELKRIFGSPGKLSLYRNDLFALADKAVGSGKNLPKILSICGSEDFMIQDNRHFNKHMKKINYPDYHSFEYPGSHSWEFWDRYIQDVLDFFISGKLPE